MSKAVKMSIIIMVGLLLASIGIAFLKLLENDSLTKSNASLKSQIADYEVQETKLIKQNKELKDKNDELTQQMQAAQRSLDDLEKRHETTKDRYEQVQQKIETLNDENEKFESRIERITKERDELVEKLRNQPEKIVEKIVYRDRPVEEKPAQPEPQRSVTPVVPNVDSGDVSQYVKDAAKEAASEEYWAGILRQKAALEVQVSQLQEDADKAALEVVELKNANNDLQLTIDRLKNEKESIVREIKQGEDLANNLSIQLARARNEQRHTQELSDKIKKQNAELQTRVKELVNTKLALEKSIAKVSQEKNTIQRKLLETENVIQSRIDEIWQLKETLDNRIETMPVRVNQREVELPPIIVNAANQAQTQVSETPQSPMVVEATTTVGHSVISVNEENNFVIVDKGAKAGAKVGDKLSVYRGGSQIGTLEIIQARDDISAADIRTKTAAFKVGDTVR